MYPPARQFGAELPHHRTDRRLSIVTWDDHGNVPIGLGPDATIGRRHSSRAAARVPALGHKDTMFTFT
jgi:hypothetical protein